MNLIKKIASIRCPLCGTQREIRTSKNGKPYVVCDSPCGLQMFVRRNAGINALQSLAETGNKDYSSQAPALKTTSADLRGQADYKRINLDLNEARNQTAIAVSQNKKLHEQISELEKLAHRVCPDCKQKFSIQDALIKTSWLNGSFIGFKCPNAKCKGIVLPQIAEEKK